MKDDKHTEFASLPTEDGRIPPPAPSSKSPFHETEELTVGGPWNRFPRVIVWTRGLRTRYHGFAKGNGGGGCRRKILRAIMFIFAAWMLLNIIRLSMVGITTYKAMKSLKCIAITPGEHADGLSVTIPLSHSLIVHDTLSGGDIVITHDDKVANGTAKLAVKFANDTKLDAVYDGCLTKFLGSTAVGLIPREKRGERAKISTFSIHVPASLPKPAMTFLGTSKKHISDKKLRKLIQWGAKLRNEKKKLGKSMRCGRKSHGKTDKKPIEAAT